MYTTEELEQLIASRGNKLRGINNPARGINLQYSNIEYSNIASNLAETSARDLLAATSSSLGESEEKEAESQEIGVSVIAPSGINNPADIWGIEAQQCIKRTARHTFHLTIQTYAQSQLNIATKVTVYTYPYDRLREYKPDGEWEKELYEVGRSRKDISIGRITERGRKGNIIADMLAYTEMHNDVIRLSLMYQDQLITIDLDQAPTQYQNKIYSCTGRYGQALLMPGRRLRVSLNDCTTTVGGH